MDLLYDAGGAWADKTGLGPCGVIACLVYKRFYFQIAIGPHEDYGPGPSHAWNITDEGNLVDFSLYPHGKVPDAALHKYGEPVEVFDTCKAALSDIFALGPGTDYEEEWKEAKRYFDKYQEMVGWWRMLPELDRYNILLDSIKVGPNYAARDAPAPWAYLSDHEKLKIMQHYGNYISPGGCPTGRCPL